MLRLRRRRGRGGLRRYLGTGETVLLSTRQHPFALVRAGLDTLGLVAPLMIAAWGIAGVEALRGAPGTWLLRLLFLAMVAFVLRLAWSVLAWELERIVVTNEKVIHVGGVLDRRIASTPLSKVSEFTVRQPLLGRVFDYGSLVVDVPGGRPDALHGVAHLPDPAGVYRLVSEQARRGRHSEGGGRVGAQVPTKEQLERLDERAGAGPVAQPPADPWQPVVQPVDSIEHTIQIPRIEPR
jgi:hypothetical protein